METSISFELFFAWSLFVGMLGMLFGYLLKYFGVFEKNVV